MNGFWAFCEDSFCGLGAQIVVVVQEGYGKIYAFVKAPQLSGVKITSCARMEAFVRSPSVINVEEIYAAHLSSYEKAPSIESYPVLASTVADKYFDWEN